MSGATLLDANVLVALFDPDHVHHDLAHDWFSGHRHQNWATCAVTESGFVRILSNPKYGGEVERPATLGERLRRLCAAGHHPFWAESVSLREAKLFNPGFLNGHRQITDIYLLGLAKRMNGRLATFDRTIPLKAVVGAQPDLLQVIAAVNG